MRLSDKWYDILQAAQKMCLLLSAFYVSIAVKLNLPYAEEVEAVAKALAVLLLGMLEMAKSTYRQDQLMQVDIAEALESAEDDEVGLG